jgi:hypothetical protein
MPLANTPQNCLHTAEQFTFTLVCLHVTEQSEYQVLHAVSIHLCVCTPLNNLNSIGLCAIPMHQCVCTPLNYLSTFWLRAIFYASDQHTLNLSARYWTIHVSYAFIRSISIRL